MRVIFQESGKVLVFNIKLKMTNSGLQIAPAQSFIKKLGIWNLKYPFPKPN